MAQSVPLPDGSEVTIRAGETPESAYARAKQMYPEAFAVAKAPEDGPKSGFMPALKAGFSGLKSDVAALAGRTGLMGLPEAEKYIAEQKKYQRDTFAPTKEGFFEAPLANIKELAGGSIPYMVAPLAAGAAALPVAGVAGTVLGLGAAGAASAAQFTGSGLTRQMEPGEGMANKSLGETDLVNAALASIPMAALDTVSMRMIPGLGKMFERAGVNLTAKAANDLAKEGIKKTAADYLLSTGKTMGVEGLTEASQQVFERMQAGLAIDNPAARAEYFESFLGGATLGGILAPVGRYVERGQEQTRFDAGAREKQIADRAAAQTAAQQAAAEEQARVAQAEAQAAAQKQDPQYALQAQQDYLAAEQTQAGLLAQLKKGTKEAPLLEADKQENAAIQQQLKEHAVTLKKTAAEFNATKRFLPVTTAPTTTGETPAGEVAPAAQPVAISPEETIKQIEAQIEALQTQAQGATPEQIIEFGAQHKELKNQIAKIKRVTGAMNKAKELGKIDLAAKHAKTLADLQSKVVMPAVETAKPNRYDGSSTPATEEVATTEATTAPKARKPKAPKPLKPYTGITEQGLMFPETGEAESVVNLGQGKNPNQSRKELIAEFQAAKQVRDRLGMQNAIEKMRTLAQRSDARSEAARGNGVPQGELSKGLPAMMGQKLTATGSQAPSRELINAAKIEVTPETLRRQVESLPENLSPENEQLVNRMLGNFDEFTADPERALLAAGFLQDARIGAQTARSRDVAQELSRIEASKASPTLFSEEETPVIEGPRQPLPVTGYSEEKAGPAKPPAKPALVRTPQKVPLAELEAADAAKRKDQNERAERLSAIPGESISFEAYRTARDTVGDVDTVSARLEELSKKAADESLPKATRNKARRDELAIQRSQKYIAGSNEGLAATRAEAEIALSKLLAKIENQASLVAENPTPSRKKELAKSKREKKKLESQVKSYKERAQRTALNTPTEKAAKAADARAERFMRLQEALAIEGTTGALPAREVGPTVRKAQAAGNILSGDTDTTRERTIDPGLKPEQGGAVRQPTPAEMRQIIREASELANARVKANAPLTAAQIRDLDVANQGSLLEAAFNMRSGLERNKRELQEKMDFSAKSPNLNEKNTILRKEREIEMERINGDLYVARENEKKLTKLFSGEAPAEEAPKTVKKAKKTRAQKAVEQVEDETFGFEFSRGKPTNASTVESVTAELAKAGVVIPKEKTHSDKKPAKLTVFKSVDDFTKAYPTTKGKVPSDAKGLVYKEQAFLFADNIGKGEALGVMLHEVGAHIGFRNFFNPSQYNAISTTVKNWAKRNDGSIESKIGKAALARVEAAETPADQVDDEIIAYAVEEAVKAGIQPTGAVNRTAIHNWLKMVVDAFKKALAEFGINPSGLKAGDLVNFAYGCAQLELQGTWHGSDAKFTAFDTAFAGEGEGAFDRRFEREKSLGVGPYVTADKDYAEYYQTAVTFGKASNATGYGDMSYQQFRDLDEKFISTNVSDLSPEELRTRYESNLLTRYLRGVQEGDSINPKENKAASAYIAETKARLGSDIADTKQRLAKSLIGTGLKTINAKALLEKNLAGTQARLDAVKTLDVSKIKGLKERPKQGNLYRTLDAVPDERVYQVNSYFTVGDRPKLDALLEQYGDQYATQQAEREGKYPANGLFFDMREKLGVDEATRVLKAAGIDAIEQNNEGGAYVERAFIGVKPEILGTNLQPIGPAKGPLFSRVAKYESNDALSELADLVVARPKTLREKAGSNVALQLEMQVADMRAGVIKALNNAVEDPNTMGSTRDFRQAIFSITAADQHGAVTQLSLTNGPPEMFKDSKGYYGVRSSMKNGVGGVFEAIQEIPDSYGNTEAKMGLASIYMIAQRAMNKGLKKLDLGALGVTEAQLSSAMAAANADPKLKAALENARTKYNAYNRGMIEWLSSPQVAAITQADAKAYLKDEDYVPYYRVRADGVAELVFGGEKTITIGDIRHQPYLAELKGGETKIMPLDQSIMRNTMLLVTKGMNNMAMKNVAYAMQAAGQGLGPVDKAGKPTNLMPVLTGKGPADASVIRWTQEPDPSNPEDKGDRHLRVQTNGTVFGGVPAELIIKSLEGAHLTLPGFLKWGGIAGDLLRAGVTRTPIYLARQLFRDPFAATATSGLDYGPLTAIFKANREFLKIATGKSETGAKLIEKGLMQSGMFEGDPANMSKMALQLASGKSQGVFDKMFAKADKLALQADAATRALIYENAIKNGLSEVEASHSVRESMNFSKRGLSPTVQYASRMIPFFNAQIQGLSVLFKAATGNMPANDVLKIKRKFYNNAMMLTGFGIAYAMAMDDDEYYKNAKPRDRYTNFFVPLPGVDEPLKLPIPYEFGFFFSAGVALADAIKGEVDTPQQLRAIKDMFVGSIPGASSNLMPQIIKPVAEVYANKSFFSGNALVSGRLEKLDPVAQYNTNTTEFAKWMATMVPGLSPIQLEHIVSGYLGQIPLMVLATTNDLFRDGKEEPTRKLSEMPLIGSSFQRKYGGEEADVVYKLATEASQAKRTFDDFRKQGKVEDAKEYLREHRAEISVAPIAMQYQKIMGALRTQEEIIRNSTASPDAKAKRIDDLDKQRQLQSERYLKAIRRAEEAAGRTTPP